MRTLIVCRTFAVEFKTEVLDKQVFVTLGSAEKLPYEDEKFDLVTAVETVYFWPNLPNCLQEVRRVLKQGGKFAILVEVVDSDSKWTTEIHRKKPTYATIIGVKA